MARIYLDTLNRRVLDPGVGKTGEPGEPGAPGDPGDPGAPGDDGAAATIAIGTVTTLGSGESATVNNSGSSSNAVFNFGIPQGEAGSGGGGVFDSGADDPNDNIYSPEPPDGAVYIRTDVGAYIFILSLEPHWRQFAS